MSKLRYVIVTLLIGMLVLTACQSPAPAATPTPATSSGAGESGSSGGVTAPTAAPAGGATATPSEAGQVEVADVSEGLSKLDSYKLTFEMSFEGKDANGQPKTSAFSTLEEFSKNPLAKHTTVTGTGDASLGTDGNIEIVEVDGKQYTLFGAQCIVADADSAPEASAYFNPSEVIGDINTSQLVGVENVNGMQARHYLVDVSSLQSLGTYTNVKAEVWITGAPVEFVVRYTFEGTGTDTFFSTTTGEEGTLRWKYELSNINQPIDISPPETCSSAPQDIPIMADATDNSAFGGIVSYSSPSAFADVVDFYKSEMPARGWTQDTSSGAFETESFTTLAYKKDSRTASITITGDPGGSTSVLIQINE